GPRWSGPSPFMASEATGRGRRGSTWRWRRWTRRRAPTRSRWSACRRRPSRTRRRPSRCGSRARSRRAASTSPRRGARWTGRLCADRGSEWVAAAVELSELAQAGAAPGLMEPAAEALTTLLEEIGAPVPPATRAALAGRLAWLLDKQGADEGALHWLRVCLEGEAEGAVAVAGWR